MNESLPELIPFNQQVHQVLSDARPRPPGCCCSRLALPIAFGHSRVPGIKIHDTRMIRLMEVLLHSGTKLGGWRIAQIHQAILTAFGLKAENYTLTQLRYDLRKMKAHGLVERDGKRYAYRLTAKGNKAALLFVLFHKARLRPSRQ